MNSNIQHNRTKQKLWEKLKNIFTLSSFADLSVDPGIQQSIPLHGLFPSILSVLLTLFLFSGNVFAAGANLAWDASTSSNVGGYKISYGTSSGNYATTVDVGNTTTYSVSGLQEGTKYYFAAKAYDSTKTTESAYSNEVNFTVPVETLLTADFTADKTSGPASLAVNFTPVTTGTITGWKWDFPGSYTPSVTNSTAKITTATYPNPGTYSVSLTVTGSSGSVTNTKPNLITVTTPISAPVANFSATPTSGIAPVTVSFTDASTGSITSRSWNFGDGTTSTAVSPTHLYSAAGTYTVSLTVTGTGGSNTKTGVISLSSPTAPPVTNSNGLVAAYGFEEPSGATVADASGKGNHGTIKEAVRIATGKYGKALKFDGVNDWVTVNDSASLDLSTGLTLEAWVYPQSTTIGGKTVILKEQSGGAVYNLYAVEDTGLPLASFNDGSYRVISGPSQLPVNQWTHLVATYDTLYQRLYVNGVQVAQRAQNTLIQPSSGVLRIGGNSLWGEFFKGYIDEVRIYNRALTAAEVNSNLATAISVSNPAQFVMGNKALEPWVDYKPQGTAEAFQTIPAKSGIITTVQVYLDATSTATQVVAGVYKNYNGHPRALVAKGTLSTLKPGVWNSVPIPVASVTAGQPYWVAILGSKGQIGFRDRIGSGTGLMETSASTTLTSLPATWTATVTKANASMSIFGEGY